LRPCVQGCFNHFVERQRVDACFLGSTSIPCGVPVTLTGRGYG
jgi:hypothetical protein